MKTNGENWYFVKVEDMATLKYAHKTSLTSSVEQII